MTRHRYTLVEVLFFSAVLLGVLAVVARSACDAMLTSRQFSREAMASQQLALARHAWQHWLAETSPSSWTTAPGSFAAGDRTAALEGQRLIFAQPGRTRPVPLPTDASIEFEAHPAERFAVLTVRWPTVYGRRRDWQTVRLVAACPSREVGP